MRGQDNVWHIDGADAGRVGAVDFSGIENLFGDAGADIFMIGVDGRLSGLLDGSGGDDTLDYSERTTGVVVDLATGAATDTGAIADIENVMTGAGDDTIIGALAAENLDTGAGTDTLDFSAETDLTVNVQSDGTVDVTDGIDAVENVAGVENIVGGSGETAVVFQDGASLPGTIGGTGTTTLNYAAYTTGVTVNLGDRCGHRHGRGQ